MENSLMSIRPRLTVGGIPQFGRGWWLYEPKRLAIIVIPPKPYEQWASSMLDMGMSALYLYPSALRTEASPLVFADKITKNRWNMQAILVKTVYYSFVYVCKRFSSRGLNCFLILMGYNQSDIMYNRWIVFLKLSSSVILYLPLNKSCNVVQGYVIIICKRVQ